MPLSIRPALERDVPLILEFIRGLAEYERMLDQVQATEERLRASLFAADGRSPDAHCVIGSVDGVPAGFALYFFNYSTFLARPGLYLEDLFVKPEHRGAGLGKALLLHLAALAHERGCGRMEWAVLDWNEAAIGFYESLGAKRLPEWQLCRLDAQALATHSRRGRLQPAAGPPEGGPHV
jgi:GNAT superfamily N-acetyltransferase